MKRDGVFLKNLGFRDDYSHVFIQQTDAYVWPLQSQGTPNLWEIFSPSPNRNSSYALDHGWQKRDANENMA